MKVTAYIWKYRALTNYTFSNYFLQPELIDKIQLSEIPIDGIPIYNEQLEKSDGVLEFTAGDFDLKLSLLSDARSTGGDSIKDFLLPSGARNFFYICIIEFGEADDPLAKRTGGRIELGSIEADLTEPKNKLTIQFKVTGILRELADIMSRTAFTSLDPHSAPITLEMFISGCLMPPVMPDYLGVDTAPLRTELKIGFEPVIMTEVFNAILTQLPSKWEGCKELMKGLGFIVTMRVKEGGNIFALDYPQFIVKAMWRSSGALRTIKIISNKSRYSDLNAYKNYFVLSYRSNVLGENIRRSGMLALNDGTVFIADGKAGTIFEDQEFIPNGTSAISNEQSYMIITNVSGVTTPVISSESAVVIELPTYTPVGFEFAHSESPTQRFGCSTSLASLFCRHYDLSGPVIGIYTIRYTGVDTMVRKTIGVEYSYFVIGIKDAKLYEIVYDKNAHLNIYDNINIENKYYFCKGITKIDLIKEKVLTEWIEV